MFLVLHDACCMRYFFEAGFTIFTMAFPSAHMLLYVYILSIVMTLTNIHPIIMINMKLVVQVEQDASHKAIF